MLFFFRPSYCLSVLDLRLSVTTFVVFQTFRNAIMISYSASQINQFCIENFSIYFLSPQSSFSIHYIYTTYTPYTIRPRYSHHSTFTIHYLYTTYTPYTIRPRYSHHSTFTIHYLYTTYTPYTIRPRYSHHSTFTITSDLLIW